MATTEERLAALEAKMAQLTVTTPTTYYTHQYSGEEIDNAVTRALPNGAIDQSVGTFVRPNLLDNWYFGRPVNQRGQTEYAGNVYGVDRWKLYQPTVSVTVREDGLGIRRTSGDFYTIVQYVDNSQDLAGKTVTFSCLILAAPGAYRLRILAGRGTTTVIASISSSAGETGIKSVTATLPDDVSDLWVSIYTGTTAEEYVVAAAKLELGPTQTLAHREGDRWALNEMPEYGEQLRRCQRYFRRIAPAQYAGFARGCAYNANSVRVMIPFETMRTSPSLKLNNAAGIFASNGATGDVFGLSFSSVWTSPESITFDISKTGAFVDGKEYILRGDQAGYIDVIADL